MKKILKSLQDSGLYLGRMIALNKSTYRLENPKSIYYFNANIVTIDYGIVWSGDLDLTKDGQVLKSISNEVGSVFYILRESDCFSDTSDINNLITKAVWNTSLDIPVK